MPQDILLTGKSIQPEAHLDVPLIPKPMYQTMMELVVASSGAPDWSVNVEICVPFWGTIGEISFFF